MFQDFAIQSSQFPGFRWLDCGKVSLSARRRPWRQQGWLHLSQLFLVRASERRSRGAAPKLGPETQQFQFRKRNMKIIRAKHLGMCFGVRDAISLALER